MSTALTIDNLRAHLFAALAADATLLAWAASAFPARPLLVTDGLNPESEKELAECPAIAVCNGEESEDERAAERTYSVDLECRVRAADSAPATGGDPVTQTRVYRWPAEVARFASRVAAAAKAALDETNTPAASVRTAYEHRLAWPVVLATVSVTVRAPILIGGEINLID